MKKILSLILAIALIAAIIIPTLAADNKGTTIRLGSTEGTVTVKNASSKAQTARKDMRLYNGYSVQTASVSSAYLTLDDTKAAKLDALSKAEVKKSGKQLEIKLATGKLYFGVTQPLSSDESLNICTSTMVTGVRGSYGWVMPNMMGLLHGHVTVTCRNPYTGEVRVTEVTSGQIVYFDPYADGAGAEPQLLEIDFIKRLMRNEDVPAIAISELRADPELQELINSDVDNLDVPTLLGLEAEKRAAEEAENAALDAEIAEAMAEQDAAITGAQQYYIAPDEATSSYIVTLGAGAGFDTAYGGAGGEFIDATHYRVNGGETITVQYDTSAYGTYLSLYTLDINNASVASKTEVTQNTVFNVTLTVTSDIDLTDGAHDPTVLYTGVTTEAGITAAAAPIAVAADVTMNSSTPLTIPAQQVLIVNGVNLTIDAGITVNSYASIINEGTMTVNGTFNNLSSDSVYNYNNLTVSGTFNNGDGTAANAGKLENRGTISSTGYFVNNSYSTLINSKTDTPTFMDFSNTLINRGDITNFSSFSTSTVFYNNGTVNNESTGEFSARGVSNGSGVQSFGSGIIYNRGTLTVPYGATLYNRWDGTIESTGTFKLDSTTGNTSVLDNAGVFTTTTDIQVGADPAYAYIRTNSDIDHVGNVPNYDDSVYPYIIIFVDGGSYAEKLSFGSTETSTTLLGTPEKDGYTFEGWYENEARTGTKISANQMIYFGSMTSVDDDAMRVRVITLYANWVENP